MVAVVAAATLSACSHSQPGSAGCPSYVDYPTPAAAARDADLVAHGTITDRGGSELKVRLVDVAKGDERSGATITIAPPSSCDSLQKPATKEVQLLLVKRDGRWTPITPSDGVTVFDATAFAQLK